MRSTRSVDFAGDVDDAPRIVIVATGSLMGSLDSVAGFAKGLPVFGVIVLLREQLRGEDVVYVSRYSALRATGLQGPKLAANTPRVVGQESLGQFRPYRIVLESVFALSRRSFSRLRVLRNVGRRPNMPRAQAVENSRLRTTGAFARHEPAAVPTSAHGTARNRTRWYRSPVPRWNQ